MYQHQKRGHRGPMQASMEKNDKNTTPNLTSIVLPTFKHLTDWTKDHHTRFNTHSASITLPLNRVGKKHKPTIKKSIKNLPTLNLV